MQYEDIPIIKVTNEKYVYNYNKLLGIIKEKFKTQEHFSSALGIGRVSLSQRLNGKLEFSQNEILLACKLLEIKESEIHHYFFNATGTLKRKHSRRRTGNDENES